MPGRVTIQENELVGDPELRRALQVAVGPLTEQLKPRRPLTLVNGASLKVQNLVGSALLPDGTIVDVQPKVGAEQDWARAVVQLLEPGTRIAVTGSRRTQSSGRRNDLLSAIALEYARRLEVALRSDGPLHVYEHRQLVSKRLSGHLNVTRWLRSSLLDPTAFPIDRDELTPDNDFARGLSIVAGLLSRAAQGGQLISRLRRLQTAIVPGCATPVHVNPAVAKRTMPTQWAKYRPAWDIAAALLSQRSPVGDPGRAQGLEVAIEPWPLLETLLVRTLHEVERLDPSYALQPKTNHPLLKSGPKTALSVIPDAVLDKNGAAVATFEAKYTVPGTTPSEDHVYQALSAAAALGAPLAVLVYPGSQAPQRFTVSGFHGSPAELATVGLELFSYTRGASENRLAGRILGSVLTSSATLQPLGR